jgi:IS4 transposase
MFLFGLDSIRSQTRESGQGLNHMLPHRNTVMHDLLARVPWPVFEALVKQHNSDKHIRKLPTKTQFIALAFGQMAGIAGLRETVTVVNSHEAQLYHLGARPVKISTLSDANRRRPSAVYETLFAHIAASAHKSLRQELDALVYLIDSTSLKLNNLSGGWARFSEEVCGAKLHIIHDPDANQPVRAVFSAANVNDITVARDMPIVPGATYVFDLGYYHFGWWQAMHEKRCRFVTRLKTNTKLTVTSERPVPSGSAILSDRTGRLPARLAGSRRNPFRDEVREVRVHTDTGKILRILTNDLNAPAEEIAALYKRRWAIELYFRWIKQTLAIRKFIGTSENAVRTHIFIALIVFLLLRMAHANQTAVASPLDFVRLARPHLMNRRDITRLRPPQPRRAPDPMPEIPNHASSWWPPHEFSARLRLSEVNIHRMRRYEN